MPITTIDIAHMLGISQSTVSRALNDSHLVSTNTKEKVLKIAEEQGFEFNAHAKGLSSRKTGTIGLIYPENFEDFSVNLYFSSLHSQLRDSLEEQDFDLIVLFEKNRQTHKSNIKRLIARRKVDGLIIIKEHLDNETINYMKESKIPFVFFHFSDRYEHDNIDRVYCDHLKGGYLATEYLIKLNHKKIICVASNDLESNVFQSRTEGYRAALKDYGLAVDEGLIISTDEPSFRAGYNVIMNNAHLLEEASAIFAHTDITALGVKEALQDKGYRVPQDISLVGYDDIELCQYFKPYLTTIHQPREQMAKLTCERLVELINAKRIKRSREIVLQPTLIIRDSCQQKNLKI